MLSWTHARMSPADRALVSKHLIPGSSLPQPVPRFLLEVLAALAKLAPECTTGDHLAHLSQENSLHKELCSQEVRPDAELEAMSTDKLSLRFGETEFEWELLAYLRRQREQAHSSFAAAFSEAAFTSVPYIQKGEYRSLGRTSAR